MIALFVIVGLVAVGLLSQQLVALWHRSSRPSIDRYHRAMGALGEMSDHVKVLDLRPPNGKPAPPVVLAAPAAASDPARDTPAPRPVLPPHATQLYRPIPLTPRPRIGESPLELHSGRAPKDEQPVGDASSIRRWRLFVLAALAVLVVGGVLAGVLMTSSAPTHRAASAKNDQHSHRADVALPVPVAEVLPNVVGVTAAVAESRLTALGLQWHLVKVPSQKAASAGSVLTERPAVPGTVAQGSVVTLGVGKPFVGIKVPDVTHSPTSAEAAEAALASAGFRARERLVKATTPPEVALQGDVLSQSPAAGSFQAKDSTVTIAVVGGAAKVTLPTSIIGETPAQAGATLAGARLIVGSALHSEFSPVPAGDVASSSPSVPGQSVAVGSSIDLVISLGPAAIVPNLRGDTLAEARRALRAAGLLIGAVRTSPGPSGLVVAQAAKPGRELRQRTPITVVVGSSPAGSSGTGAASSSSALGNSGP